MKPSFGNCYQDIDANGGPDLSFYGIGTDAVERFDFQILLDPAKKQLHLPPIFIQLGDDQRGQVKLIDQKHEGFFLFRIEEYDAPEVGGEIF